MKLVVLYYSLYGHIYAMADAVAKGAREVKGTDVLMRRVPETLPREIIEKMGAGKSQDSQSAIPVITLDELASADAIVVGTPTRYGNPVAQISQFFDSTGQLWAKGALVGKVGSAFPASATQHGGNEATILSVHKTLLHHGMIIVGLPYAFAGQMILSEISGCSPYGATTITGGDGSRMPSENELAGARFQGKHVAEIASKLFP
jgi:NAD(P)H dehydrogenase (quinone)